MDAIKRAAQSVTLGTKDVAKWLREDQKCGFGVFECHKKQCSLSEIVLLGNNKREDSAQEEGENSKKGIFRMGSDISESGEPDIPIDSFEGQDIAIRNSANCVPETGQCYAHYDGEIPACSLLSSDPATKEPEKKHSWSVFGLKNSRKGEKLSGTRATNDHEHDNNSIASRDRELSEICLDNKIASNAPSNHYDSSLSKDEVARTPTLSAILTSSGTPSAHQRSSEDVNHEVISPKIKNISKIGDTQTEFGGGSGGNKLVRESTPRQSDSSTRETKTVTLWEIISLDGSELRSMIDMRSHFKPTPNDAHIQQAATRGNVLWLEKGCMFDQKSDFSLKAQYEKQKPRGMVSGDPLYPVMSRCNPNVEKLGDPWISDQLMSPYPSSETLLGDGVTSEKQIDRFGLWSLPRRWLESYTKRSEGDQGYNALLLFCDDYLVIVAVRDVEEGEKLILADPTLSLESYRTILQEMSDVPNFVPLRDAPRSQIGAEILLNCEHTNETMESLDSSEAQYFPLKRPEARARDIAAELRVCLRGNTAASSVTLVAHLQDYIQALQRESAKPNRAILKDLQSWNDAHKDPQIQHLTSTINALYA